MLRITIDLIPYGDEHYTKTIGLMEIANDGTGDVDTGNYICLLKKTPPYKGALKRVWRSGKFKEAITNITAEIQGFKRQKRGVYDLLYRALVACGIDKRIQQRRGRG